MLSLRSFLGSHLWDKAQYYDYEEAILAEERRQEADQFILDAYYFKSEEND
jgi:hypothetical protein